MSLIFSITPRPRIVGWLIVFVMADRRGLSIIPAFGTSTRPHFNLPDLSAYLASQKLPRRNAWGSRPSMYWWKGRGRLVNRIINRWLANKRGQIQRRSWNQQHFSVVILHSGISGIDFGCRYLQRSFSWVNFAKWDMPVTHWDLSCCSSWTLRRNSLLTSNCV